VRVRYGYRKILVLLHREGWQVGKFRLYRFVAGRGVGAEEATAAQEEAFESHEAEHQDAYDSD
jgi:putative transposase